MDRPILTERQIRLLKTIGANDWLCERFVLTGGTALAAFYLHHRYSEDLDFFSTEDIDVMQIGVFFRTVKEEVGFASMDFQSSFNRNLFFLKFSDEVLKTEFTYFPFERIQEGGREYGSPLTVWSILL